MLVFYLFYFCDTNLDNGIASGEIYNQQQPDFLFFLKTKDAKDS